MAPPAVAQTLCAPHQTLTDQLYNQYGEVPVVAGLLDPEQLVEFWVNPDGETWTIFWTRSDGLSCIVGFGIGWFPGSALLPSAVEGIAG